MEWRPWRILTICVMILAVNYLITDHRCSILRHEQQTFMVTNATILSATLREQWSLGTVYSCLVDVQYTPMLTSSAAAAAGSSSSSSSRTASDTSHGTSTNGATDTDAPSSSSESPPMDTQSWPPVHHTAATTRANTASTSLVVGSEQKVWVELACPSSRFCQHHCQTGVDQLWYDPSSPSPTRRLSWSPPDADTCYGFIMGVMIAIGICCMGILADWMVDKKCPARSANYASSSDLAALLASSSRGGYPGYGYGHGNTTHGGTSSLYRGNHSNIHGYGSIS